jgi:hypothetical protein
MTVRWDRQAIARVPREALATVRDRARSAIAEIRCPEHGKHVRLVTRGTPGGTEVTAIGRIVGCCPKAVSLAQREIAQLLAGLMTPQ